MPIHDWTRVNAGLFHHFHVQWISALCNALNAGGLPRGYYALAEQTADGLIPDVLTLQSKPNPAGRVETSDSLAVALAPPRTRFVRQAEVDPYAARANRIAIRHPLGQVVAIVEIVSPGSKSSRTALNAFVEKAVGFLRQGVSLLIIDLFPPTRRDPQGIHKAIWDEIVEEPFELPADKPLTLASYAAGLVKVAYVEPVAVGDVPPNMPIFLDPESYVPSPLESTYQTAWSACPAPLQDALTESAPAPTS